MRPILALAGLLVIFAACGDDAAAPTPASSPTSAPTVAPGTATVPPPPEEDLVTLVVSHGAASAVVYVELAVTTEERSRGLMSREELPEDRGMLFVYARDHTTGFWMKDTPLPLDIAYLAADGTVLEIREGVPFVEVLLVPLGPYRYTLEVNRGWFERHGLGVGAVVQIPAGLPGSE